MHSESDCRSIDSIHSHVHPIPAQYHPAAYCGTLFIMPWVSIRQELTWLSIRHLFEQLLKMFEPYELTLAFDVFYRSDLCRRLEKRLWILVRNWQRKSLLTDNFGSAEPCLWDNFQRLIAIVAIAGCVRSALITKRENNSNARADCLPGCSLEPRYFKWFNTSSTTLEHILSTSFMNFLSDPYRVSFDSTWNR